MPYESRYGRSIISNSDTSNTTNKYSNSSYRLPLSSTRNSLSSTTSTLDRKVGSNYTLYSGSSRYSSSSLAHKNESSYLDKYGTTSSTKLHGRISSPSSSTLLASRSAASDRYLTNPIASGTLSSSNFVLPTTSLTQRSSTRYTSSGAGGGSLQSTINHYSSLPSRREITSPRDRTSDQSLITPGISSGRTDRLSQSTSERMSRYKRDLEASRSRTKNRIADNDLSIGSSTRRSSNKENATTHRSKSRSRISSQKSDLSLPSPRAASPRSKNFSSASTNLSSSKTGLRNLGNTCFMNSILQCLSNTKLLREYFLSGKYQSDLVKRSGVASAFANLLEQLWESNSSYASASSLKSKMERIAPQFSGYRQHDSQEFCLFVLNGIHDDLNKCNRSAHKYVKLDSLPFEGQALKSWEEYCKRDYSHLVETFVGQIVSTLTCSVCSEVSTVFEYFWDLSVPLSSSVARCLEKFTSTEILDGNDRPKCDKCKEKRKMTKQYKLWKLPEILIIHLKRFKAGDTRRKDDSNVKIDTNLSLRGHLHNKAETILGSSTCNKSNYSLYAVSNHMGGTGGGHYTASCKGSDGKWRYFNDSSVSEMSSSQVQTSDAYLLFYERN